MEKSFTVSIAPHVVAEKDTQSIMRDVYIALIPALAASIYFFGIRALLVTLVSVITCVSSEYICRKMMKRGITIFDGSAIVTGVLFAFCLPPAIPYWTVVIGASLSIVVGKEIFGGIGHNPFNPALVGRAILLASWPVQMTVWSKPINHAGLQFNAVTAATPLAGLGNGIFSASNMDLLLGRVSGSLGETSVIALVIGAVYLMLRRVIGWRIPVSFIGTVAVLSWFLSSNVLYHLFSGGLMLGALFMATDYVTSPITRKGKIIFGIGCGILTVLIRLYGGFPEGVCYAILLMNAGTPLIERYTQGRIYGQ
ncbi:MAG: RnfABCDGE type electron transport complex subunit D [bacterium]